MTTTPPVPTPTPTAAAQPPAPTDVVVCGSGAAGLAAALTAARAGARVVLLERTALVGGTTATSSGLVYAPGSAKMAEKGVEEDLDAAAGYIAAVAHQPADPERIRSFVEASADVIADLESAGVRFRATGLSDYYPQVAGASSSRAVALEPFPAADLGEWAPLVRRSPYRALEADGTWSGGTALIGYLLAACLRAGVEVRLKARAVALLRDGDAVTGVHGTDPQGEWDLPARRGVVLATGGYEYDRELLARFLPAVEGAWSCPGNEGDGLRLAEQAGAELASMGSAQWYPLLRIRDEDREGTPRFDDAAPARCLPGSIMVDGDGRRFVNEGANFHDVGRAVNENPARPAWLIVDGDFLAAYGQRCFGTAGPGTAAWVSAGSIAELAAGLELDAGELEQTVKQFNADATNHEDGAFGRGASDFDRGWGDSERAGAAACLAPLSAPPFAATRVYAGLSGTSGGPRTDGSARVLRPDGTAVPGLWAAGNAMASFLGDGCPGSGSTIGPGLVFGALAARDAVRLLPA